MANDGTYKNMEIAKALGIRPEDITKWTKRWVYTPQNKIPIKLGIMS